jgi:hypothetical protein
MKEILRWIHAENERLGIDPLRMTLFPIMSDVYAASGRTDAGRYLVVFFVYKHSQEALIISARDMDGRERRLYERK